MNKLVEKFGEEKRWVSYRLEKVGEKTTKVPYSSKGYKASSTKESDWSTYKEIKTKEVGIIFKSDQKLVGIDIDKCLDEKGKIIHPEKENILKLIEEANTYTEVSISGKGLHLFLLCTESFTPVTKRIATLPYEIYTSGRYFTVSKNIYDKEKEIRTLSPKEIDALLSIIGYPWNKHILTEQQSIKMSSIPLQLDDQTILDKMFSSKNGEKLKSLYNYKGDDTSSKDLAFVSSLAFWTGKNYQQMERIWMSSPLGQRKKTQERENYRKPTIDKAIYSCKEVYEPRKIIDDTKEKELDLMYVDTKQGKRYLLNTENICRILRNDTKFQGRLRYDTFKNIIEVLRKDKWNCIEDNDAVNYQTTISVLYPSLGMIGKGAVLDAMIKIAKEHTFDSAADYIRSIRWDGEARLDTWLASTYGAPDDIYHRAVGSNWVKGLVKRIIHPGCKFDYVLVLEGPQGTKKSTSLYTLGESWHVETTMSTDSKDFFMQFSGKAIIEFSEGETLSKTEVKRMKAIITMQSDKYRPPYERSSQDFPRHCVFAMTTNQTEYLKDETGNRRWLPVRVILPEADVEWLQANRDQIFAEAYYRVITLKETIYEFPKEETLAAQNERRIKDANNDLIVEWYFNLTETKRLDGITIHQVYKEALNGGFNSKPLDKYNEMLISNVLMESLKLSKCRKMINGVRCNRWYDETGRKIEEKEEMTAEELLTEKW